MDPSGKSPHAEALHALGFIELSDYRLGEIWVLDKHGEPERKLQPNQALIAQLVCDTLLTAITMNPRVQGVYVVFDGRDPLTGAYDYGHFWIAGGKRDIPELVSVMSLSWLSLMEERR